MLEAFQSLREELTSKKQAGVDQTSASAYKSGPSTSAVENLDLLPPRPRKYLTCRGSGSGLWSSTSFMSRL